VGESGLTRGTATLAGDPLSSQSVIGGRQLTLPYLVAELPNCRNQQRTMISPGYGNMGVRF
jgi:hypothetical protein